jgi:hypothetical protein
MDGHTVGHNDFISHAERTLSLQLDSDIFEILPFLQIDGGQ